LPAGHGRWAFVKQFNDGLDGKVQSPVCRTVALALGKLMPLERFWNSGCVAKPESGIQLVNPLNGKNKKPKQQQSSFDVISGKRCNDPIK